jgi:hypothetical protein
MFKVLAGALFSLALSTGFAYQDIGIDKLNGPKASNGLVVASFTFSGSEIYTGAHITIHPKHDPKDRVVIALGIITFRGENLTNNDGRWGKLTALNLEPGEWVIDNFTAYVLPLAGMPSETRNSSPLKRSFTVEAGKTTYIGNLDFTVRLDQGASLGSVITALAFGATSGSVSGESLVYDARDRDFKLLKEKSPDLDISAIQISLASRDARDQEAADTLTTISKQASAGDKAAQAYLNTAKILGEARLPNLAALRIMRTLHHDKAAIDRFRENGVPAAQTAFARNHSNKLSVQEIAGLQVSAAQNYDRAAINLLASRHGPYKDDAPTKALWDERESKLGSGFSQSNVEQFGLIIGKQAIADYKAVSAPRKMLLLSALGEFQFFKDDNKDSLKQATASALSTCQQTLGSTCAVVAIGNYASPNFCPLPHQFSQASTAMAPTSLPSTETAQKLARPWSAAFKEWEDKSKEHLGYPRAIAWNETTGKIYPALGSCTSSARAMTACMKDSGNSCKIIIQDDRLIEGTEYAQRISQQILSTLEKQPSKLTTAQK